MSEPEHVLSLSYGKDSLACLGAIEELGWPLDRIIHAEVWATDTIPADPPPMVEFKAKADTIIRERWGITVGHIRHKLSYEEMFYRPICRGPQKGLVKGFPLTSGSRSWCKHLKVTGALIEKTNTIQYVGIAADEPGRFGILSNIKKSPLKEIGWTEAECRRWCEKNSLLSPIYSSATRGGCWFCHNQSVQQLRLLRREYPELWALLLNWGSDSPVTFKAPSGREGSVGHTVHDYERRFRLEDEKRINTDTPGFRWNMIDGGVPAKYLLKGRIRWLEENGQ